ncbi:hypothetical protein ACFLZL_03620 [Thermodesulfobacteriota bacterium]
MNLKAKGYLEIQKKVTGDKLATRMSSLKEKGLDAVAIKRDSLIKKMKADIHKANYRLACIAAQEKLNADKVKAKAEKLAAKKKASDKPPAKKEKKKASDKPPAKIANGAPAKREKKEKKKAPPPALDE